MVALTDGHKNCWLALTEQSTFPQFVSSGGRATGGQLIGGQVLNARLQLSRQTIWPPVKYSTIISLLGAAEAATIKQQITRKPVKKIMSFN